jgi:general secretion pathway protein I
MKRSDKKCSPGFTLLEVLVALAIMAAAITIILQLFSSNLRALSASGDTSAAAAKGDARLREILTESSLKASSWHEAKEIGYTMDISVGEVLQERTDNLPVKLMEVVLTVHWNEGRKEKKLTLRTMKMVENNRDPSKT